MKEKLEPGESLFADPVHESPHSRLPGKLFELEHNPDVVIRHEYTTPELSEEECAEVEEKIAAAQRFFNELSEIDGLYVAEELDHEIVKNEYGGGSIYHVVESISGQKIKEMRSISDEVKKEVDDCFAGYFAHVLRKISEGKEFWCDMHLDQIVYGTRPGTNDSHAYIVDRDLRTATWVGEDAVKTNRDKACSAATRVLEYLWERWDEVTLFEYSRLGDIDKLEHTRTAFNELLLALTPVVEHINNEWMKDKLASLKKRAA